MKYEEFLTGKRLTIRNAGFDVAEEDLNGQLFPFQRKIVRWALKKGRSAIFANCGCVAGETIIQGPDGDERIDVLTQRGLPIRVWALDGDGNVVAANATVPFCKGEADLFTFSLASGRRITVTGNHRFLTLDGWRFASSLREGEQLFVSSLEFLQSGGHANREPSEIGSSSFVSRQISGRAASLRLPAFARSHRLSTEGLSLSVSLGDDLHFSGRVPGSTDRCSLSLHPDDGRLLRAEGNDRGSFPLPSDVPARIQSLSRMDASEYKSGYIHQHPCIDLHSRTGSTLPASNDRRATQVHGVLSPSERHTVTHSGDLPSRGSLTSPQPSGEPHQGQSVSAAVPLLPCPLLDTVVTIHYSRTGEYYDLHVPGYENYLANGVWNHNTGKTPMQLVWADHVYRHTGMNVLILAPLAVAAQTAREGQKFGVHVTVCRTAEDIRPGVNVTNYERLHYFTEEQFGGIVLDESSILKAFSGVTRQQITEFAQPIPYRLACTATPAPNDLIELINHAEFLGVMSGKEIIALFFTQDGNTTHAWRLKGHARRDFWRWLAGWAVAMQKPSDLGFSDEGFILPELRTHQIVIDVEQPAFGLFAIEALTLQERRTARRESTSDRVAKCAEIVNASDGPFLIWCDLNVESEQLHKAIPGSVEVRGSDTPEFKERAMRDFAEGRTRILVSKSSICGFGMNWQHCSQMAFVGLSDSFEQLYQATRRCWRFGQTKPVDVYLITAETEGAVLKNVQRKERESTEMFDQLISEMRGLTLDAQTERQEMEYRKDVASGRGWTLYLGDSIERIDEIETESVGLSIFSPPFPGMYVYTNSSRDLGNAANHKEMLEHFRFLVGADKLLRVVKPGRSCCVHLTQSVAFKGVDGYIGLKDFRGHVIQTMEDAGWIYYGEVCIDKDPQVKAIRTKDRGLLFKTLANDSSHMHMALADYLLQFRKPGENVDPIRAGISLKYGNSNGWITQEEWIEWAAPVWYRQSEFYPGGIRETDVLNVSQARETDDERHLCPLQLGVIERAVKLWSNPGDLVLDPFNGIGSSGVKSLELGRRYVGVELKESYYRSAISQLQNAEHTAGLGSILSLVDGAA